MSKKLGRPIFNFSQQDFDRAEVMFGKEKGINQELINKVEKAVIQSFGTKLPLPTSKKIRQVLGIKKCKKMNKRIIGDHVEVLL